MTGPSLEFLCDCIVAALLSYYAVKRTPVSVDRMLIAPPPDLREDVSLTDVKFGEAMWLRLMGGQGSIFVNTDLPNPERRYHMACALFTALCATRGGRAAGLPEVPNENMRAQMDLFARRLLMPYELLPRGWQNLPADELARMCGVPQPVAEAHLALAHAPAPEPPPNGKCES